MTEQKPLAAPHDERYSMKLPFSNFDRAVRGLSEKLRSASAENPSAFTEAKKRYDHMLVKKARGRNFPSLAQIRHIDRVLTKTDKLAIRIAGACACVALLALGVLIYREHITLVPAVGGEYTEALVGAPRQLNPLLAPISDSSMDISHLIYSGLFGRDTNQKLVLDLASSYTISEDKRVYTVKLRNDIEWHDGKPFTADDVVFTYTTVLDRDVQSPLAANFTGVKTEKIDKETVRFTLDKPYAPFLDSLTLGIIPAHVWQSIPPIAFSHAEANLKRPIGTGPYRVDRYVMDKTRGTMIEYILVRNKQHEPSAKIERIHFKFYPDFESAIDALNTKQVEGVSFVPTELTGKVTDKRSTTFSLDLPQYRATFFNLAGPSPVANISVRKALAQATNKQALIKEAMNGNGVIIQNPILPGFLGYNPAAAMYYEDIDAANKALEDAGWKLNEDGIRVKKSNVKEGKKTIEVTNELAFSITTVDRAEFVKTAELLKAQWERLGAKITLNVVGSGTFQRDVLKPRNFDVLVYDEILGADPDPYAFWHSSQAGELGLNLSRYENRDVDKLLEEARGTTNIEERAKKYRDFQDLLMQDLPAIFLMSPKYHYAISNKVQGIDTKRLILPSDRFANIENWYIKTQRAWK